MLIRLLPAILMVIFILGAGCLKFTDNTTDVDNWKTYTNETCGFSFKYPSNLVVNSETENTVGISTQEDLDFQNNQEGEVPPYFYIYVECLPNIQTLVAGQKDYFNQPPETITTLEQFFAATTHPITSKLGERIVDGHAAAELAVSWDRSTYALWIEDDNEKIYQLNFSEPHREEQFADFEHLSSIQQQILASFVF